MNASLQQADEVIFALTQILHEAKVARDILATESRHVAPLVTVKAFSAMTGYTEKAVERKRATGVWLEGRVWIWAPDNHILIDMEGYERWARGFDHVETP